MKTNVRQTSLLSYYDEIRDNVGKKQKDVLDIFIWSREGELTNSEIAKHLEWPINTVTPRVFELRKLKLLEEAKKRKCRITGRQAIAWKLKW